jgi:hypothetical protein
MKNSINDIICFRCRWGYYWNGAVPLHGYRCTNFFAKPDYINKGPNTVLGCFPRQYDPTYITECDKFELEDISNIPRLVNHLISHIRTLDRKCKKLLAENFELKK